MAGAGYEIPVSISDASTSASPLDVSAPTYFLFSSPNASFGPTRQGSTTTQPATATSSAALGGNASSSSSGSGVGAPGATSPLLLIAAGVGLLISLYTLYKVNR